MRLAPSGRLFVVMFFGLGSTTGYDLEARVLRRGIRKPGEGDGGGSFALVKNMLGDVGHGESWNAKDMDELNDSSISTGKSTSTSVLVGEGIGDRDGDADRESKQSCGKCSITGDDEENGSMLAV